MAEAGLFRMGAMESMPVARAGYEGMKKGKGLVIPGLLNKLSVFAMRFTPRSVVTKFAMDLNRSRPLAK